MPPIIVWEGDAWGGLTKPLQERNLVWMRRSEVIFSVAVGPQAVLLTRATRRPVRYAPNVAKQYFVDKSMQLADGPPAGVTLIGKRLTYLGVELIPGDRERCRLVKRLQRLPSSGLSLYGDGWRGPGVRGRVSFHKQFDVMRRSLITVGWNRYRRHAGYFSDRLPIALCAGRTHVGSHHPGLEWLPGPEQGLHLMGSPQEAAVRVDELLRRDPVELVRTAAQLSIWVSEHLTEAYALQYMLGSYLPLPPPPQEPWSSF
ncbi:glycosyltransferase family protein [Streptomyces violascens]